MPKWTRPIGALLLASCAVNLVVGAVAWVAIGGSALNGKVEAGRYYVGHNGRFAEVSKGAYAFSYWQTLSEVLTVPLGLFGALLQPFRSVRRTNRCT